MRREEKRGKEWRKKNVVKDILYLNLMKEKIYQKYNIDKCPKGSGNKINNIINLC